MKTVLSVSATLAYYGHNVPEEGRCICPFCGSVGSKLNAEVSFLKIRCYACGINFDVFDIIQEFSYCDFPKAIKIGEELAGLDGTISHERAKELETLRKLSIEKRNEQIKQKVKYQTIVAKTAQRIWENANPLDKNFDYAVKKKLDVSRLRAWQFWLIYPIFNEHEEIVNFQRIPRNGDPKYFLKHGKKQGCYFPLPSKDGSRDGILYIGEGLSTCDAINQATGQETIVALDAGNLAPIAMLMRKRFPHREIVIVGDNDEYPAYTRKKNRGTEAAIFAAQQAKCKFVVPKLDKGGKSDANDIYVQEGKKSLAKKLEDAEDPPPKISQAVECPFPQIWEQPISFDELNLPELDLSFLPDEFRELCECFSVELQVPCELVIMVFLASVGTCVQGKMAVFINEKYIEQLCTYWIATLQPAERKSAVIKRMKSILQEWIRMQYLERKDEIARVQSEQKTISLTIEAKRKKAATAKTPEQRKDIQREITELEAEMPESIYAPELFCDNITSEALNFELSIHRGLAIIEAEGGFFDLISGLYSKVPNFDTHLKAYDAESITVKRRGAPPIYIPSPHLTLCFAVQMYVLQNRGASLAMRHKGLDGRFMYFIPRSKMGFRDIEPPLTPKHIENRFKELVFRLLDIPQKVNNNGDPCYYMLHMSEGAKSVYHTLKKIVEESLTPTGSFHDMQDWQGKSVGRTLRLAGLLHCLEYKNPHEMPIS